MFKQNICPTTGQSWKVSLLRTKIIREMELWSLRPYISRERLLSLSFIKIADDTF